MFASQSYQRSLRTVHGFLASALWVSQAWGLLAAWVAVAADRLADPVESLACSRARRGPRALAVCLASGVVGRPPVAYVRGDEQAGGRGRTRPLGMQRR